MVQAFPGTGFFVKGPAMAPDAALVSAGAEVSWRNGFALAATFEGEFSNGVAVLVVVLACPSFCRE